MPAHPLAAPVSRWGDAVYQLALLIADDRATAERLAVEAFRVARQAEAGAPSETALFGAVLRHARTRRARLARLRRKHVLPRQWAALPAFERTLLGLWLLRGVDGPRLAQLARLEPDALVTRLAGVLAPAIEEPADEAFSAWLSGLLGLAASVPAYALEPALRAARAARQRRLDQLAAQLRDVLSVHLPPGCAEAIEALDEEPSGAWRRSPIWGAAVVAATLAMLLLVIAPWRGREAPAATSSAPGSDTPAALVRHAIDSWGIEPGDGTHHRRVWAVEDELERRAKLLPNLRAFRTPQPHITDIWVDPGGESFRWEVTRDNQIVEWMLGDGDGRLEYAVNTPYSACEWIDVGILGRTARRFDAPADVQKEVLQTRQKLGAYGMGYHVLRQALAAGDLRSYGRRIEGDNQLIALGYTAPDGRAMVLLFDAQTRQLRSVREVATQGAQATPRDLWRLEADESMEASLPRGRPGWVNGRSMLQASLLDPACPELRPEYIVSIRTLAARDIWWAQPYVPRELPPGIERMLLLSPTPFTPGSWSMQDLSLLMVGPERWMRLRLEQGGVAPTTSRKIGEWDVNLTSDDGQMRASLCRPAQVDQNTRYCSPGIELIATGSTEPELLAVIEQLTQVQPGNWRSLDGLFMDGAPLPAETKQLLMRAVDAALPPADGVLHSETTHESRVDPQRPVWQDPYHVPLDVLQPPSIRERRWLRYEGGVLREQWDEQLAPDGTLLSALAGDGSSVSNYSRSRAELTLEANYTLPWWLNGDPLPLALVLPVLESTEPITVSTVRDGILLQQPAGTALDNWGWTNWFVATPWTGDVEGRVERRVWLDPASARPRKAELLLIDDAGGETLLHRAVVTQSSSGAAMPDRSTLDPAALPRETVVYRRTDPARPAEISATGLDFRLPERVLVLPDAEADALRGYQANTNLEAALNSTIYDIDRSGFVDERRYQLPGMAWTLVVRQGPRDLLAHLLRSNMLNSINQNQPGLNRTSEPVAVILDGRPSTAWLIQNDSPPLLVAELDGVLLMVVGPNAEMMRGPVAEALGRMVWQ